MEDHQTPLVGDEELRALEPVELREKYSDDDRQKMAKSGDAMPDGSYPIADAEDLANAIRAVGRGANNSHNAIRRHIIARAKALGLSDRIPDDWNSDGSLKEQNSVEDPELEARRRRTEMLEGTREVRKFAADGMELRKTSDGMLRFSGYASVTERAYEVGDFEETIARGAFKRTLNEKPDVVLLVNHGEGGGLPLARTKSGTMTLIEDARGLRVDADLNPDDPDVRALVPKLERGDVDEMSFAFRVTDQEWSEDRSQRLIRSVGLHKGDVSIVTYGANDASTGAILRSSDGSLELRAGKAISSDRQARLQNVLDRIARADQELDSAQPELADILGVENPDEDDSERSAEPVEPVAQVVPLPDHTTRAKERLAQLRRAR